VPTNRKRRDRGRLDALTDAQRAHLECGYYFWDFRGELDHFVDEAHRRRAWALHRDEILAEWDRPGARPDALWEYDQGLKSAPWPREWRWPKGIESEAHMVHTLLTRGEIEPCRRSGWWSARTELEQIEHQWLEYTRQACGHAGDGGDGISHACDWGGVPRAFYRERSPAIRAELKAEAEAWNLARKRAAS
jgi:hypothetical protein